MLVAVGVFSASGPTPLNRVGTWNGQAWAALGSAYYAERMLAVGEVAGTLVVGGSYMNPDTVLQWSGTTGDWQATNFSGPSAYYTPAVNTIGQYLPPGDRPHGARLRGLSAWLLRRGLRQLRHLPSAGGVLRGRPRQLLMRDGLVRRCL